jgi:hypothetical protein
VTGIIFTSLMIGFGTGFWWIGEQAQPVMRPHEARTLGWISATALTIAVIATTIALL